MIIQGIISIYDLVLQNVNSILFLQMIYYDRTDVSEGVNC